MKGTETIKIEQPFEGDGNRIYYVNGGRCSGKVNKTINELVDYINNLQQENRKQKEIIDETINAIDLVIELIKQQPTKDDRWILDRLNGFKIILEDKEASK